MHNLNQKEVLKTDEGHSLDCRDRSVKERPLEDADTDDPDDSCGEDPAHAQRNKDGRRHARRVNVDLFNDHQVVIR